MTSLVTERLHDLAATLSDLKVRVRAAIAGELGRTIGAAVRDVLVAILTQRLVVTTRSAAADAWRDEEEREHWGESRPTRDPWDEDADCIERRQSPRSHAESDSSSTVPAAAAVAVGVHVGRWWLSRHGGLTGAVAAGVLVASLGLASGPAARAALAVLAAAADVLTGGSSLPVGTQDRD